MENSNTPPKKYQIAVVVQWRKRITPRKKQQKSIHVPKEKVPEFISVLTSHAIIIANPTKTIYEAFRGYIDKESIIIYKSGQIVYTNNPQLNRIIELSLTQILPIENGSIKWIIGSDEAGKGEVLGPLVVASVIASQPQIQKLRLLGVQDSKRIADKKIGQLYPKILETASAVHYLIITPHKFTILHQQFLSEGKTLNDLLAWAHAKTLDEILKKGKQMDGFGSKSAMIVIDEFDKIATEHRLKKILSFDKYRVIQQPKAESIIPVAAASIIARSKYLEWIGKYRIENGELASKLTKNDIAHLGHKDRQSLLKLTFKNA